MSFIESIKEKRAESKARNAAGGFKKPVGYVGGHPEATAAAGGTIALVGTRLSFTGNKPPGFMEAFKFKKGDPISFALDVKDIVEVDYKTADELRRAPQHFFTALPGFHVGMGSKPHPAGLLVVTFRDRHNDLQKAVFTPTVSWGGLPFGHEDATKIVAARSRAKDTVA